MVRTLELGLDGDGDDGDGDGGGLDPSAELRAGGSTPFGRMGLIILQYCLLLVYCYYYYSSVAHRSPDCCYQTDSCPR